MIACDDCTSVTDCAHNGCKKWRHIEDMVVPNSVEKWDRRFLELSAVVSKWSKDPSTKVGAVVVDENKMVVSMGFNGMPRKILDLPDRYQQKNIKYEMIVHGEMNALLVAPRTVRGCTLYTYPFAPCSRCASMIVQTGIARVVAPTFNEPGHWMVESVLHTGLIFKEAGIKLDLVDFELTLMLNSKGVYRAAV